MAKRFCVLFDLDGTLTQSEDGIWNCLKYMADKLGYPVPDESKKALFVGPPLEYSFRKYMGMPEERIPEALAAYRERYFTVFIPHILRSKRICTSPVHSSSSVPVRP